MRGTTTHRFQPVRYQETRSGTCPVCGKSVVRKRIFEQTLNPFNKSAIYPGQVKEVREIHDELIAEAITWKPDFRHVKCRS